MIENYYKFTSSNKEKEVANSFPSKDSESRKWFLLDNTLYDLCKKYPFHTDANQIQAKMCLIGRSYSAAIERRRNADATRGDFYYDYVVPAIMESNLDDDISALHSYSVPTEENMDAILKVHKRLQDILKSITEQKNRSFASKYLHFHLPNLFYLYDSISRKELNAIVRRIKPISFSEKIDAEYADYCYRALLIQKKIAPNHRFFPRLIDIMLQSNFYNS